MRPLVIRKSGNGFAVLALLGLTFGSLLIAVLSRVRQGDSLFVMAEAAHVVDNGNSQGLAAYLNVARQFLSSGVDTHNQVQAYNSLMPNEDPRTAELLRDTIDRTSNLITDYQHDGLSNMPPLTNVPGLNAVLRIPDKLMRAELSMLQDGIRMAEEMRLRPISATLNTPTALSNMLMRMLRQLNQ